MASNLEDGISIAEQLNATKKRRAFMQRVLTILAMQFFLTVLIILPIKFIEKLKKFIRNESWILFIPMSFFLLAFNIVFMSKTARRRNPCKIILFATTTVSGGLLFGLMGALLDRPMGMLIALTLTLALCILMILLALQSKCDLSPAWSYATIIVLLLAVAFAVTSMFAHFASGYLVPFTLTLALAFYLVTTVHVMRKGTFNQLFDVYDSLAGAVFIYLVAFFIFISILSLVKRFAHVS